MTIDKLTSQRATNAYHDTLNRATSTTGAAATPASQGSDPAATPPPATTPTGAVIALSPGAQTFARALAAALSTPEVRANRVAAIQARLANQPAEVDADALATKLLGGAAQ